MRYSVDFSIIPARMIAQPRTFCAWCKSCEKINDEWIAVDSEIERLNRMESSHGICGACFTETMNKIQTENSERETV